MFRDFTNFNLSGCNVATSPSYRLPRSQNHPLLAPFFVVTFSSEALQGQSTKRSQRARILSPPPDSRSWQSAGDFGWSVLLLFLVDLNHCAPYILIIYGLWTPVGGSPKDWGPGRNSLPRCPCLKTTLVDDSHMACPDSALINSSHKFMKVNKNNFRRLFTTGSPWVIRFVSGQILCSLPFFRCFFFFSWFR